MNLKRKIIFYCLAVVLLPLIFFLTSCTRCSPDEEMHFRVNEELLGLAYADSLLAIEMHIPRDWIDITEDIRMMVEENFKGSEDIYEQGLIFKKGYGDLQEVVFMLIFDFEYRRIDFDKDRAILTFFSDFSETTEVFKQGTYTHNEIRYFQLTSREKDMINIKILGYGNEERVFAIDYYIPEIKYKDYIETIESSIGSISRI